MAQKLLLPLDDCQLNAGYKVARYRQHWGFTHYGVDLAEVNRKRTLRACGAGTVIAAGMDGSAPNQRLGNCVVVVYRDVRLNDGRVSDLACRMFHLDSIACKAGDRLTAGSVIGEYGNTGAYTSGPHLHIEFDTDTKYPQHAYGIAQSGNIIKKGDVDSTIDPCTVLWLGTNQKLSAPENYITDGWVKRESLKLPPAVQDGSDSSELTERLAKTEEERAKLAELVEQIHRMTGE